VTEMSSALKQTTYDMYQQVFMLINYSLCKLSFTKQKHWFMSCPKDWLCKPFFPYDPWEGGIPLLLGGVPCSGQRLFNLNRRS